MSKTVVSVDEVLKEMTASKKDNGKFNYNRFNKKNFDKLLKAMLNDPKFTTEAVHVKKGTIDSVEEIEVSKGFRKFCKKIVEKCGVDKTESERVLSDEFSIDSVDGLYEFMATAIYLYIQRGNRFDFIPKKDFKGSVALKTVPGSFESRERFSPQDRKSLGVYEITKKDHSVLCVKSSCPDYLKSRKKK